MQWTDFLAAFALYLVLEGFLPFVNPAGWRNSLLMLSRFRDGQLRFFGLIAIIAGLALLVVVRGGA